MQHSLGAAVIAAMMLATPAAAQDVFEGVTSTQPSSAVSVSAERRLNDGRLVLRIAAQNRGSAPVAFGPASIRVTVAGEPVALVPLATLVADVRAAAGLEPEPGAPTTQLNTGESPAMMTNNEGQRDVGTYTGSMGSQVTIASARRRKPASADAVAAAEAQIAALEAGVLTDGTIAPGGLMAGQVVSEKFKLRRKRDRGVDLVVTVGTESHSFHFDAPSD